MEAKCDPRGRACLSVVNWLFENPRRFVAPSGEPGTEPERHALCCYFLALKEEPEEKNIHQKESSGNLIDNVRSPT